MEDSKSHLIMDNPEVLGQGERKLWTEVEPVICELLCELKDNGKIETAFASIETRHLRNVITNLYQLGINNTGYFDLRMNRSASMIFSG